MHRADAECRDRVREDGGQAAAASGIFGIGLVAKPVASPAETFTTYVPPDLRQAREHHFLAQHFGVVQRLCDHVSG